MKLVRVTDGHACRECNNGCAGSLAAHRDNRHLRRRKSDDDQTLSFKRQIAAGTVGITPAYRKSLNIVKYDFRGRTAVVAVRVTRRRIYALLIKEPARDCGTTPTNGRAVVPRDRISMASAAL